MTMFSYSIWTRRRYLAKRNNLMRRIRPYTVSGIAFMGHMLLLITGTVWKVPLSHFTISTHSWFDHFIQWDSNWYGKIAKYGYITSHNGTGAIHDITVNMLSDAGFFPLVPIVVHIFGYIGSLVIGNLLFYVGLVVMYRILTLQLSERRTFLAMMFYSLNPAMVFESALYAESYLVLFSLLSFYGIRCKGKKGLAIASLAGFLASFSHELGIFLGALALRYLREKRYGAMIIYITAVLSGWGLFSVYLSVKYGHPLAMFSAQQYWHRVWKFPGYNWIEALVMHDFLHALMVLFLGTLMLLHIYFSLKTERRFFFPERPLALDSLEVSVWLIAVLLLGLSAYIPGDSLLSVTRFFSTAWPLYSLVWIKGETRGIRWTLYFIALSTPFALIGVIMYTHGYLFD